MKFMKTTIALCLSLAATVVLADPIAMSPTSLTAKNLFDDLSKAVFPLPSSIASDKQQAFCSAYAAEAMANCNKVSPSPNLCRTMSLIIKNQEFQISLYHRATMDQNIVVFCEKNAPTVGQPVPDCETDTWTLVNYKYDSICGWK